MVVGNGLIAKAFNQYKSSEDVIIFASGVSNSGCNSKEDFERELNLIKEYLSIPDKKFIYFSTCSISDGSKKSDYINHKISMEEFIMNNHNNYIIFRLPIVVGVCDNKNTFFNNIRNKILNSEAISVYANLSRYLIDIEHLTEILPNFIESEEKNYTMDICFDRKNILEIVETMERVLGIKSTKVIKNDDFINSEINNSKFISKLKDMNFNIIEDYTNKTLIKYLK
jgi:nucleoside-diphosphate-sugar epimerase